ncbi:hypothetical protein SI65_02720 [Aspergillus cristatus]|uniref:Uncharacterized protein n=1 Tax=Aspergillus cristatus TaxID=573508 RepID=A0A1E3BND4_ASPCR|nr:hypothetical protein SI65_02720 [Aspergillus cristatus]
MFQNPIASYRMSRLIYELVSPRVSGLAVIDMSFLGCDVMVQEIDGLEDYCVQLRKIGGEFVDTDTETETSK